MKHDAAAEANSSTTLPEIGDALVTPRKAHVLTLVLRFDDLLRNDQAAFRVLSDRDEVRIGRGLPGGPSGVIAPDRLLLEDQRISTDHAVLLDRPEGPLLVDRGSRNGTYCNGQRIRERILIDGDLIQVGHSLLCYRALPVHLAALTVAGPAQVLGPVRTLCPEVVQLVLDLQKVAPQRESVLITGETGVGKEVVAHEVHRLSRRPGEFRAVNGGAVPDGLFESTFFGHRRGAFTGASEDRDGEIIQAQLGTLLIDEVGTMSRSAQAKLLRVIEDERVTPIGASRAIAVDVRWVSATNSNLLNGEEDFRSDLLQRLAGYVAQVPPLRRRREDLGILSAHFLRQLGLLSMRITPAAGWQLYGGSFPGNIRQLRKVLRVAATLAGDGPIDEEHLRAADQTKASGERLTVSPLSIGASAQDAALAPMIVRSRLWEVLMATQGNVMRAARILSVDPRQVYRWVDRYALDLSQLRAKKRGTELSE